MMDALFFSFLFSRPTIIDQRKSELVLTYASTAVSVQYVSILPDLPLFHRPSSAYGMISTATQTVYQ